MLVVENVSKGRPSPEANMIPLISRNFVRFSAAGREFNPESEGVAAKSFTTVNTTLAHTLQVLEENSPPRRLPMDLDECQGRRTRYLVRLRHVIGWTRDVVSFVLDRVQMDLRRSEALMPHQLLNGPDIHTEHEPDAQC
jgi:hypothetical protein